MTDTTKRPPSADPLSAFHFLEDACYKRGIPVELHLRTTEQGRVYHALQVHRPGKDPETEGIRLDDPDALEAASRRLMGKLGL